MELARDIDATIEGLRPYLIHAEPYVVVYYSQAHEPEAISHAQLSADALPSGLKVGDRVTIHIVMGVVAGITAQDSS